MLDSVSSLAKPLSDTQWGALKTRTSPPGFYYAVKTTGIFCRPNCRSRLPRRENAFFFASPAEAMAAGFRPCKRCQPAGPEWETELTRKMVQACRLLEQQEEEEAEDGSLVSVAKSVGLSLSHFHRLLKNRLGVTPKAYQAMQRLNRFRRELRRQPDVTSALYGAGFRGPSRAYDQVSSKLGMTPRQYQKGGLGALIWFAVRKTTIGWVAVAQTERGVCAIEIGDTARELRERLKKDFPQATLTESTVRLSAHIQELLQFLDKPQRGVNLPLDIRGTAFQTKVWQALRDIPPGKTVSYKQLAQNIGRPQASRAVGAACGANRIAIAIPCHRVVHQDGTPGDYRWGISTKKALLRLEESVPPT